jgi:hypothetical protein
VNVPSKWPYSGRPSSKIATLIDTLIIQHRSAASEMVFGGLSEAHTLRLLSKWLLRLRYRQQGLQERRSGPRPRALSESRYRKVLAQLSLESYNTRTQSRELWGIAGIRISGFATSGEENQVPPALEALDPGTLAERASIQRSYLPARHLSRNRQLMV